MTYAELEEANKAIKPTDIGKNKEYAEVNQRIKAFRMLYPNGTISTALISNEGGVCIFRAEVLDDEKNLLGTGTAYEKEGSTFINKTSYIENCETSAVGRALAMCGIGIDVSIASKEEVENAKLNQNKKDEPKEEAKDEAPEIDPVEEARLKARVIGYVTRHEMPKADIDKLCKCYKVESLIQLNAVQCQHYISLVEKRGGNIDE